MLFRTADGRTRQRGKSDRPEAHQGMPDARRGPGAFQSQRFSVALAPGREWRNGRRAGLRIRCRKAWGFKSPLSHHPYMSEQMQERTDGPQVVKIEQRAADYNLTEHCNLRCAGCDHSSPLLPKKFAEVAEYQRDLATLSQVLHLGELKILGGEPLLHPDLIEFLRGARASGIADEITLVTNGVLLHRCDPVTFELIDKLWVSLYPGVRLRLEVSELEALSKKYNFKLELKVMNSFRFTTINRRHRDAALVRQIFTRCALAHEWSCHTIHEGYYFKCSPAPFLTARMALRGESVLNRESDGVRIHNNPRLREELEAYLRAEEPLEACYYCLGSSGRQFPHRQMNSRQLRGEINASHPRPRALLESEEIATAAYRRNPVFRLAKKALKLALRRP